MGLVYLPTLMVDFYGKCTKYTIHGDMDPMEYVFPTMYTWIFQGVRFMDDI